LSCQPPPLQQNERLSRKTACSYPAATRSSGHARNACDSFSGRVRVVLLYVGREIFIPIAIAILVSFVLSPPILLLRRWGLGRVISVLTVVFAALVIAFSVSAVLTRQVSELAIDLPLYQATINAKLDDLRGAAANNALFAKVSAALKNFAEINPHRPAPSSAPAPLEQPRNQLTRVRKASARFRSRFISRSLAHSRLCRPSPEPRCLTGDDLHRRCFRRLHSFATRGSAQSLHQACRIERFAAHDPGDE